MPEVKLVSLTTYARKWRINRSTVYDLLDRGLLTKYFTPKKIPLVDLNQRPPVQKYTGKRKRRLG